jgi:phage terminase large subunit-like protein
VRSIVNRTMAGVHGEGSSSLGRSRLGLTGRRRDRAPFTQWPPQHVRTEGTTRRQSA